MFSSLTYIPNVGVPLFTHSPDRKWWLRNRKWRPFGFDWVPLEIKTLYRKKWGVQTLSCSQGHIGVFITFMACFRLCIFIWSNSQLQTFITMNWVWLHQSVHFRHPTKVRDHHCDGAKVVPCELITFDLYSTTYYRKCRVDMPTFFRSLYNGRVATRMWLGDTNMKFTLFPPVTPSTGDHMKSNTNFSHGNERKISFIASF